LHGLEHLTFLVTALVFWWGIVGAGRRARFGPAVFAVFLASLPCTALGAALALADHPWYARYATLAPATALADQQMAGVVMWSLGGMAYVIAGVALFYAWVSGMERSAPARAVGSVG
jgi:cytochrome c oxidase assembly factor CtaG